MVVVCGSGDGVFVVGVRMQKCGAVVVTTMKKFSFVRVDRTSGAWVKIGHGMNCEISGKNKMVRSKSSDLVDGKGWGGWGKLDPHVATQIHGSNPTKLQHTNKSQKKIGAIFGGDFWI